MLRSIVLASLNLAAPAAHAVDYALGSMHAVARVHPGQTQFESPWMAWDRTVLWQDLSGQLGLLTVTAVAPPNAQNPRVSSTGDALTSNPHISVTDPYASMRYSLGWTATPLPRTGVITSGFDVPAALAPAADPAAPHLYRSQSGDLQTLVVSIQSGLPAHGSFFNILPDSTLTFDVLIDGRWTLGSAEPGGASRTLIPFSGTGFVIEQDFVYDQAEDLTRLRVTKRYTYGGDSFSNALRLQVTLVGDPVPAPGSVWPLAACLIFARRRRTFAPPPALAILPSA